MLTEDACFQSESMLMCLIDLGLGGSERPAFKPHLVPGG